MLCCYFTTSHGLRKLDHFTKRTTSTLKGNHLALSSHWRILTKTTMMSSINSPNSAPATQVFNNLSRQFRRDDLGFSDVSDDEDQQAGDVGGLEGGKIVPSPREEAENAASTADPLLRKLQSVSSILLSKCVLTLNHKSFFKTTFVCQQMHVTSLIEL